MIKLGFCLLGVVAMIFYLINSSEVNVIVSCAAFILGKLEHINDVIDKKCKL